jgi:CRP-like cAMP-binding protein
MDGVLDTPAPRVFLTSFDDFSVNYEIRYWINEYHRRPELENVVRTRLWYALRRAGMTIPFPIRDVTVREVTVDQRDELRRSLQQDVLRGLKSVELFRPLSEEQIKKLAENSSKLIYSSGETLVRQGDSGDSLFIITSGEVEISISDGTGSSEHLADLGQGEYFGEMSLLTGELRSASVTAKCETEVIMVKKSGMSELLENEASIIEPLSAMLEKRLQDLSGKAVDRKSRQEKAKHPDRKEHLLNRIRDFFGIG